MKEGEHVGGDATVKHRTEADSKVENGERSGDVGDGVQQAEKEDSDRVKEEGMEGEQLFSIPVVTSTATTPGHYSTKVRKIRNHTHLHTCNLPYKIRNHTHTHSGGGRGGGAYCQV